MTSCPARIFIGDDRYGGFLNYCDRTDEHTMDEQHESRRSACEPVGKLVWHGTYVEGETGERS